MHAKNREAWINARAFQNRNPHHKGRHGVYRSTVTRPISVVETRFQGTLRKLSVTLGIRPAPIARHA